MPNFALFKEQLAHLRRPHPHLVIGKVRLTVKPGVPRSTKRDGMLPPTEVLTGKNQYQIRNGAIGGVDFVAIQDKFVAAMFGGRFHG